MKEHAVLIVGGGPTGLMLAGELALAGVDVAIVERRLNQEVEGSRASGLHPRSIELLDQRGIAERFVAKGTKHYAVPFAGVMLDAGDRTTRHNYTLALWQAKIEQELAAWVSELSVPIYRGREATNCVQEENGVNLELRDGSSMRAKYLVGCDGGRSVVRKKAGIGFGGWDADLSYLIFEADMTEAPVLGMRYGARGVHALGRMQDGKRIRGVVAESHLEQGDGPNIDELRAALVAAYGADFGLSNITWLSRFNDAARQAAAYRQQHILLAGDAAHVHSPVGGQGLNIGLQDAVNLGWKLAQVVKGISPDGLLDTYHAERHPVGAALLELTLALTALNRGDPRTTALRAMMAKVMQLDEPRRWYSAMISGLDIHYDSGEGHVLLGRRMPDLDLVTEDGPRRLFTLLHDARPVLLDFGELGGLDLAGWTNHIKRVGAKLAGACELPMIGSVQIPAAVLIRPDGHVAWAAGAVQPTLVGALSKWFGSV